MPILALSGAGATTGFRLDGTAEISLLVSVAVVIAFARDCFGRSRAAMVAAVLLLVADVALNCAVGPLQFIALWQLQWCMLWGLSLFFAEEDVQAWLGRLLMAGWLFDALLIAAALGLMNGESPVDSPESRAILAWGCALSLACRVAALPVGAHALWNERPLKTTVAWMLLACLPSATILAMRLIELLAIDPAARLGVLQLLAVVALAGGLTSLRQESAVREIAWRLSAGLAGVAAISLMGPPWVGRVVWLVAAAACVFIGRRLPEGIIPGKQVRRSDDLLGRLESAAAREWNLPRVWKFGVAMPVRGASQVLRFVDGFLFEQIPGRAFHRLETAASPVRRALPELFSRLLLGLVLGAAFIVLLALAFR